jgi:sporulation protein YlmC with PRC-barrel domain
MVEAHAQMPEHADISSEDLRGAAVCDSAGKKIGTIDHLMIDKMSGRVRSVVLSVRGFVGLGHSHAMLPWNSLSYNRKLHAYQTQAKPEWC